MPRRWMVRLWRLATCASGAWFVWEWLVRSHYGHAGVAFFLTAFFAYWLLLARIVKPKVNAPTGSFVWRDRRTTEHQPYEDE